MDESKRVNAEDIDKLLADGKVVLLDVREQKELEETGAVKDSIHIPIGQLEGRLGGDDTRENRRVAGSATRSL